MCVVLLAEWKEGFMAVKSHWGEGVQEEHHILFLSLGGSHRDPICLISLRKIRYWVES